MKTQPYLATGGHAAQQALHAARERILQLEALLHDANALMLDLPDLIEGADKADCLAATRPLRTRIAAALVRIPA